MNRLNGEPKEVKRGNKYHCGYTSGDGTDYDEGDWIVKTCTPKIVVMEKITEKEIYDNFEKGDTLKLRGRKCEPTFWWYDGDFTVYPSQCGTPYLFTKIKEVL